MNKPAHKTQSLARAVLVILLTTSAIANAAVPMANLHRSVAVTREGNTLRPSASGVATELKIWADPAKSVIWQKQGDKPEEVLFRGDLHAPYGLALDADAQRLIWTSSTDGIVQTLDVRELTISSLTSSFDDPAALEMPLEGGKQAITVVDGNVVRVSLSDTSSGEPETEVLMSLAANETVHGLAWDRERNVIYVGNAVGMMVYKIDLTAKTVARLNYTDNAPPVPDEDIGLVMDSGATK